MAKKVSLNGRVETKAGLPILPDDTVELLESLRYASRGGLKLERALDIFGISPQGWEVIDVGASTGGFTDCWLQRGAEAVYAVDVGYGQLDWRLRSDARVTVVDRTNARYLTRDQLGRETVCDGASIDVSFIGIRLVLEPLRSLVKEGGTIVALVKPQFEAGRDRLGKGGVVRDPKVHEDVLESFVDQVHSLGYGLAGLIPSPIRGPEGNIEFLAELVAHAPQSPLTLDIPQIVAAAWQEGRK